MLEIRQFRCLQDNFGVLLHEPNSGATASIDAPDAEIILELLTSTGWTLTHILCTHHHGDHVAGNMALKAQTGCHIIGPAGSGIPARDQEVSGGQTIDFAGHKIQVISTPGHTLDHIAYWFPDDELLFAGDTLFSLGCGRLFEGTPTQMWRSLQALCALPGATRVYCGHEYTEANAQFALHVDRENQALQARAEQVKQLRERGEPTVPVTLAEERETNPFLRVDNVHIRHALAMPDAADVDVFAELRRRKDQF